jgi:hypothetical protein
MAATNACSDDAGQRLGDAAAESSPVLTDAATLVLPAASSTEDSPGPDASALPDLVSTLSGCPDATQDAGLPSDLANNQVMDAVGPYQHKDRLAWSLGDLYTDIGPSDLYLLCNQLVSVPPEKFAQYAQRLALFTWPELEPIPFTTVAHVATTGGDISKIYLQFTPPTNAPRWYLATATLDGSFEMTANPAMHYLPNGVSPDGGVPQVVGVRFMTASHPCVYGIEEGASSGGPCVGTGIDCELWVNFSEVVDAQALGSLIQLAEPAQSACSIVLRSPTSLLGDGRIAYNCTRSVIKGLSFTITSSAILNGPSFTIPPDASFYDNLGSGLVYRFDLTQVP